MSGSGYNTEKGIYAAFCMDNGPGKAPTPCVGGVDMSGESGASAWVSSNPPPYGEGLTEPYDGSGHKGSFSVQIKVRAKDADTDCTKSGVTCAVITRNDHTRGGDQSQTARWRAPVRTSRCRSGWPLPGWSRPVPAPGSGHAGGAPDTRADVNLVGDGRLRRRTSVAGVVRPSWTRHWAAGVVLRPQASYSDFREEA
ncbi:hypothetical protein [Streptomyces sp. KR55]|uniref:hypothetical protein n=1 Tax=Streptomyces sp. KR55 TaxID=3457425 RepID=UPI003FD08BA7